MIVTQAALILIGYNNVRYCDKQSRAQTGSNLDLLIDCDKQSRARTGSNLD